MKFNRIAAASAALIIAGVGTAQADSFASATLILTGVKWINTDSSGVVNGSTLVNGQEVTVQQGGQNSANASGSLNGIFNTPISATSLVIPPNNGQIPFNSTCIGAQPSDCVGNPPNDGPPTNQLPNGKTYVYQSYSLSGAVIDVTGFITGGATASLASQVDLSGRTVNPSAGVGSSTEGANSEILITATTSFWSKFIISSYDIDLLANIVTPYGATDSAKASTSFAITLRDITEGSDILNFRPSDLNIDMPRSAGQPAGVWSKNGTNVYSEPFFLHAGEKYQISISSTLAADASRNVIPEPDSLALFGIGMIGIIMTTLMKRKASVSL